MKLSVKTTPKCRAQLNMNWDKLCLNQLEPCGLPILHLYRWRSKSITYGHFVKKEEVFDLEELKNNQIDLARRVTGGGVTLHFCDYAFSFFMPKNHPKYSDNTLENYAFVNGCVAHALSKWIPVEEMLLFEESKRSSSQKAARNFCMAKPTVYDIVVQGKKVVGAAQRKTARGYLHHGSIAVQMPQPSLLKKILKDKEGLVQDILKTHYAFLPKSSDDQEVEAFKLDLEQQLIKAFRAQL